MTIRECLPTDALKIEALFKEFVGYLRSVGDQTSYDFGAEKYLRDGFGPDPAFRGLVATDGSGLVGYVLFCRTYDGDYVRGIYVVDLFVKQDSRGRGIGRALIDAVRNAALAAGCTRLSWAVHKGNESAIRFYRSLGARIDEESYEMFWDIA